MHAAYVETRQFLAALESPTQPAAGQPGRPFSPWQYLALVALSWLVLALRQPEQLLSPTFVAEDGAEFFATAFNLGTWDALLRQYAGYYHIAPRLIAEAVSTVPASGAPLFYSICALSVAAVAYSWFYLPIYRHLIARDSARLAVVLLFLLAPNLEGPTVVAYVQWPLAVMCTLLALMPFPPRRWQQVAAGLFYLLAILTAPALVVLLPLWIARLATARTWAYRLWCGAVVVTQALVTAAMLPNSSVASSQPFAVAAVDLGRAVAYKGVVASLLGEGVAGQLLRSLGWTGVYAAAGLLLLTCAVLLYSLAPNRTQVTGTIFLFMVLVSPLLYFPRSTGAYAFAVAAVGRGNERYFLLANFGLCCLIALLAAPALAKMRPRPAAGVAVAGLLALAFLQIGSFRLPPWGSDESIEWHRYGWLVQQWQRADPPAPVSPLRVAEPPMRDQAFLDIAELPYRLYLPYYSLSRTGGAAVNLPIIPDGWCMFLAAPADTPPVYSFPEGPVLLTVGAEPTVDGDRVRLAWQGSTLADPVAGIYYTAYAHRVDDQGNRRAGADVQLAPAGAARCGGPLLSTHEWPQPSTASTGVDDLVVGLYHLRDDRLVDGSSILIEDFFALR